MGQSLSVDPEGLKAQGATFLEIGEQARRAVEKLKAVMAEADRPWGRDEAGRKFAEPYQPDANKGVTGLRQMAESLHNYGSMITEAADSYEAQDQAGGSAIRNTGDLNSQTSSDDAPSTRAVTPATAASAAAASNEIGIGTPTAAASTTNGAINTTRSAVPTPVNNSHDLGDTGRQRISGDTPRTSVPDQQPAPDSTGTDGKAPGSTGRSAPGTPAGRARGATPAAVSSRSIRPGATPTTTAMPGRNEPPRVSAARDQTPPATPWSKPGTPSDRSAGGRPGARTVGTDSQRAGSPGRLTGATSGKEKDAPHRTPWSRAERDTLTQLAQELADKHDLLVVGFGNPDLDEPTAREFASAVDEVLTVFPIIDLRSIEIGELDRGGPVRVMGKEAVDPRRGIFTGSVVFDVDSATDPHKLVEIVQGTTHSAPTVTGPGSDPRPAYVATVREFGRCFDSAGKGLARTRAQKALIAEFMSSRKAEREQRLGRVTSSYRQWCSQLGDRSFDRGRLDAGEALVEAFAAVMLDGTAATEPAKALNLLLIQTAILVGSGAVDARELGSGRDL